MHSTDTCAKTDDLYVVAQFCGTDGKIPESMGHLQTRPILSQSWSFKDGRLTFLNYLKFAYLSSKIVQGPVGICKTF